MRYVCYNRDVADLNLRDIPDELYLDLKVAAATAGVTLKQFCINLLRAETPKRQQIKTPPRDLREPVRSR